MTGMARQTAYEAWTEHRFFKYRGCAPDVDDPGRAAGDPSLSLDAWVGDDRDGGESQREREARVAAAKAVCQRCPVLAECDAFADTVKDGKLLEPVGIRGGKTALERHRRLIAARAREGAAVAPVPAPDRMLMTVQKQAVLAALAVCWKPAEVMERAELSDVRKANWQRSQIVRLLGLPKDASRMRVLEVARERGVLPDVSVVADDGTVRAIPPETKDVLREVGGQRLLWPSKRSEVTAGPGEVAVRRGAGRGVRARSLRRAFAHVDGQEELSLLVVVPQAGVCAVFPVAAGSLGAVA
ncbi:WhiB family transcriptional regulator [Streptomyces pseudovenezuelae]|uniref:WhiB family transcriptional regulator n=1 Tax=Streptomyces pseudovenezuelae TaxID=67350 RepID=UPI002E814BE6|nr:WhiB family transcriptional regulator [Streptomyces pseudovenezuelae]WUA94542.1 WhiB family transcriptional regulator [Streptomyces pseudovenezuelae]